MTLRDQVLQSALGLPAEDRAFVIAALERSLDRVDSQESSDAGTDILSGQELLDELDRRWEAFLSGATTAHLADDVLAEQYRQQADEESK
jgi:DNA-binding IscR family transcriptional regulator